MACPHLPDIAALLKSAHPEWSPAAIKSVIMTTGSQVSRNGHAIRDQRDLPADMFAIGSGHVNPPKAHDPGLAQLNYPSFSVSLKRGDSKTYSRTVTNVGMANSSYTIRDISVPQGISIMISSHPPELSFTSVHQKLTYQVTFTRDVNDKEKGPYGQGHMAWVSGKYTVRTPFSFKFE
ncbi:hypothetical protein L1987_83700 [Smallanthus sonchifolius]|uniref:Uncharacterized protein n=1 Tax=Smallanthus sonchifolius TaxID=185202 RepID=A0ACB8YDV2_9ASTR|nr:hypothetical protein L1987_83700 [Smallanthus sonchifolius]